MAFYCSIGGNVVDAFVGILHGSPYNTLPRISKNSAQGSNTENAIFIEEKSVLNKWPGFVGNSGIGRLT